MGCHHQNYPFCGVTPRLPMATVTSETVGHMNPKRPKAFHQAQAAVPGDCGGGDCGDPVGGGVRPAQLGQSGRAQFATS